MATRRYSEKHAMFWLTIFDDDSSCIFALQNKNQDVASIYTANTTAMMLAAQTRETITLSPLQTTDHTKKSDIASSIKGNVMHWYIKHQ